MKKLTILLALLGFICSSSLMAQGNSLAGCIAKFHSDVRNGSTMASANYQNCISKISPGGGGGSGEPTEETPEMPVPEDDFQIINFHQALNITGITALPTATEQILEFERLFADALLIIRNVDITGYDADWAQSAYISYIIQNDLIDTFYAQANWVLIPGIQYSVLTNYINFRNLDLPTSWIALGYTLD